MKKISFILVVVTTFVMFSCSKEDTKTTSTDNEINKWIYEVMDRNYLWYKDMPDKSKLRFDAEPNVFFASLLSNEDRASDGTSRYSQLYKKTTIAKSSIENSDSYGFEFSLFVTRMTANDGTTRNAYLAKVLYVIEDSPAYEAGIKRGDFIISIDDNEVTPENYKRLLKGAACRMKSGRLNELTGNLYNIKTLGVRASRGVDDNPVFLYKNIETSTGNVGYLVYNHFTTGPNGYNDKKYDNALKSALLELRDYNPKSLILDLRYNGGGYLSSCIMLSTMLAPKAEYGNVAAYQRNNDRVSDMKATLFQHDNLSQSDNLGIENLYVIVSKRTASASEAVINILNPFINVTLLGTKTEGKNVGSVMYTRNDIDWELNPIVFQLYNSKKESDYGNGFIPQYDNFNEALIDSKELGDPQEYLLKCVLNVIETGATYNPIKAKSSLSESSHINETDITSLRRNGVYGIINVPQ